MNLHLLRQTHGLTLTVTQTSAARIHRVRLQPTADAAPADEGQEI